MYLLSLLRGASPVRRDPWCSIFILHGNLTFIFTLKRLIWYSYASRSGSNILIISRNHAENLISSGLEGKQRCGLFLIFYESYIKRISIEKSIKLASNTV
jgi:hypothetical protein